MYDGISLHLLAYLFDPEHEELAEEMSMALDDRVPRAKAIVAKLAEAGHPITWELVLAQLQDGATVGRPHIADTLVAAGVVPDRTAAFDTLLHDGSEFFVGHYYVDAVRAVQLVREAGGVPVFAHPAAAKRGPTVGDDAIEAMAAAGLAGLEVDHRDNPPEAPRAAARARRRPRPAGDRRQRLPRHRQGEPARREHHRPGGVRGAARASAQLACPA